MTHRELLDKLFNDQDIYENIDVSDNYEADSRGNTTIVFGFETPVVKRKKSVKAIVIFTFNKKGRLIQVEVGTHKKGERDWQVATSQKFINFLLKGFVE
jgi:hypothetical protein